MKPKEEYHPQWIRTGNVVPRGGVYLIRCARFGCSAVDRKSLPHGSPCPPCLRCCNPAQARFLHDEPAKEVPPETAPRPIESLVSIPPAPPAEAAPSFIRTKEFVPKSGTWSVQCDRCGWSEEKFQHKGAWADPCSRCKSTARLSFLSELARPAAEVSKALGPSALQAWGWHDVVPNEQDQIVEVISDEAPTDPKKNATTDESSSAERKPTLFERLGGRKAGGQKTGAKLGGESSRKKS